MRKLRAGATGPLAGVVVVDLTRVLAGPYCTMVLADLGARVIKVELPEGGDDSRGTGPFVPGPDGAKTSAYFFSVNRNKESIALDLKAAADRAIFEQLVDSADVLVENFRPGAMQKLGYDWASLKARWPALILASISGFGQSGPYSGLPAYDMVVQAMGGVMSLTGPEGDGQPVRVGVSIGDLSAGMFGAIGVLSALIERARTGAGKHVDVAMLDCQVAMLENALARFQVDGRVPGPIGSRHPSITPFAAFRAQDGHIVIAAGNDPMFRRLCEALDRPALAEDARFATNALRAQHHAELAAEIDAALAHASVAHWRTKLEQVSVPCAPLHNVADIVADPQVRHRNMLVDLPTAGGARLAVAGTPIKFADEADPDFTPAPELDQHRGQILAELASG